MDTELSPDLPAEPGREATLEPEADSPTFYVHKDGVSYGPDSADNLHLLCAQGWLRGEDLIWREGAPEWQPARTVFPTSFFDEPIVPEEEEPPPPGPDIRAEDPDDFFEPSTVRISSKQPSIWGPVGLAFLIHGLGFLAVIELLRLFPVTPYVEPPPPRSEPPLEVAMVSEPPAPPPQPPPPPDVTPPTPPPPMPMPDLAPPPPPAPAEMPLPTPPLPTVPPEEAVPQLRTPVVRTPHVEHRKARPLVIRQAAPMPQLAPAAPADAGAPEYLADPRPEYPIAARMRHQEGTVLLLVTMDESGNPVSVSIEQSSGFGVLDAAALKQVRSAWRFKPGSSLTVHVPVEFHIEE